MLYVVPTRHRSLALLGVMLVAQVLLLAIQIPRSEGGRDVPLIRVWALAAVTPFQRAGAWVVDRAGGAWNRYVGLQHTDERNQQLQAENNQLKLRIQELEGLAAENVRLSALLEFQAARHDAQVVAARVIGSDAAGGSRVIRVINRGSRDGLRPNLAVITPDGVVGKTIEPIAADTALVLLLSDKESGVGVLFADTRTHGVVRGLGEPWLLMDHVVAGDPVSAGQRIVTSGWDKIYPKDLPVGTVIDTTAGSPFQKIRVQPAARLDRLEEVFVLLTPPAPAPVAASGEAAKPKTAPK